MINRLPLRLEAGRIITGPNASHSSWGPYGAFRLSGPCSESLMIVASAGDLPDSYGWEHVSVSTARRTPNWAEMCFVKDLFWSEDECVIQFHPPKSEYVNNHPYCLHLWRAVDGHIKSPPSLLIGVKERGVLTAAEAHQIRREMDVRG